MYNYTLIQNSKIKFGGVEVTDRATVVFDKPFTDTPVIVLTARGSSTSIAPIVKNANVSAAGFDIITQVINNGVVEQPGYAFRVDWIACCDI